MPEIIVKLGDNIVHKYYFDKEVMSVGRARDNDIVIENLSVSRNHSRIRLQDGKYILTDLNSANGTFVNGIKVSKTEIVDDDIITIGKHKLHFINRKPVVEPEAAPEAPARAPSAQGIPLPPGADGGADAGQPMVLVVTKGKQQDQSFPITKPEISIGRANENDIRLHDWFVSKKHAVLIRRGSSVFIKDLGSWRGTTVNGNNVKAEQELQVGDEIVFGTTVLEFRPEGQVSSSSRQRPSFPEPVALPESGVNYDDDSQKPAEVARQEADETGHGGRAPIAPAVDDEYAPMTDDELELLESEAMSLPDHDHEALAAAEWEMAREGMASMGEAIDSVDRRAALLGQHAELAAQEAVAVPAPGSQSDDDGDDRLSASSAAIRFSPEEEEKALFGPGGMEEKPTAEAAAPPAPVAAQQAPLHFGGDAGQLRFSGPAFLPAGVDEKDVAMWEKGLRNKSKLIRKQAARELKKLTGRDYEWESEVE